MEERNRCCARPSVVEGCSSSVLGSIIIVPIHTHSLARLAGGMVGEAIGEIVACILWVMADCVAPTGCFMGRRHMSFCLIIDLDYRDFLANEWGSLKYIYESRLVLVRCG